MDGEPTNANPTRRQLLRVGIVGGAVLALGGIGVEMQSTAPTTVPESLRAFSPRAFRVLTAFADTVCPGNDTHPPASTIGIPAGIDDYVATVHPTDAAQLEQALRLLESPLAGLFVSGTLRPFSRLARPAREAVLLTWRNHRFEVLRSAYIALRNLVVTAYYDNPRVHAVIGYPGPPDFGQSFAPAIQPRQPVEIDR